MADFLEALEQAESRDVSRRSNASTASSKRSVASSKKSVASSKNSNSSTSNVSGTSSKQGVGTPAKAANPRGSATPQKGALRESNTGGTPARAAAAKAPAKPDAKQQGIAAKNVAKEIGEFGFKVLGPIAAGAFSTIVKAKHVASGNEVAVKTFLRTAGEQQEEHDREMHILRTLATTAHAHVANLLGEYDTTSGIHAILHYCSGGSLKAYLGKLAKKQMAMVEPMAAVVTAQVASALSHLHSIGVAHRDIKPANVLYDGERWRVCDFGFAIECGDKRLKKTCGTLQYSAPELVANGSSSEGYLGAPVDLWAFGCLVYEMRLGRSAFVSPDLETLKLRIKNGFKGGSENHPWLPNMTKPFKALVTALLATDPDKRLAAAKVLTHKWVTTHVEPTVGGADDAGGQTAPPPWWCDVAGDGCLRPTEPRRADEYSADHRCWHYQNTYMVCEVCYVSGRAEHASDLVELPTAGAAKAKAKAEAEAAAGASTDASSTGGEGEERGEETLPMDVAAGDGTVAGSADAGELDSEGTPPPPPPPPGTTPLELELLTLKAKHGAGSRLEAVMMELEEERSKTAAMALELQCVRHELEAAQRDTAQSVAPGAVACADVAVEG